MKQCVLIILTVICCWACNLNHPQNSDLVLTRGDLHTIETLPILIDSLKQTRPDEDSIAALASMIEAYAKEVNTRRLTCDTLYVDSAFVHRNTLLALQALKQANWGNAMSAEIKEEYIFPYKLEHEIADDWREVLWARHQQLLVEQPQLTDLDSLYHYHMAESYYQIRSTNNLNKHLKIPHNFSWLDFTQEGDCLDKCRYVIYNLRAAGAPATFDYLINWGNRPVALHSYVGLANKTQQLPTLLDNTNERATLVNNLNAAMSKEAMPDFETDAIPDDFVIQYEKTIPKVYRQTWNVQTPIVDLYQSVARNEILPSLIKPNMLDVTNQYLKTSSTTLWHPFAGADLLYLSTFDLSGWLPVAYARPDIFGKAQFDKLAHHVVYFPSTYNGEVAVCGNPFRLTSTGKKISYEANKKDLISMTLKRKFPLFVYSAQHAVGLKGLQLYGSNDYKFNERELLGTVDKYPFTGHVIDIQSPSKYRYYLLEREDYETVRLAQVSCIKEDGTRIKDIRYEQGTITGRLDNLYDDDYESYVSSRWTKIDLGDTISLDKLRVFPRSDTNFIIPGNEYELFYWDDDWVSMGRKTADDYQLHYDNVPPNAVYWLRCHSGGKEERIFTYEDEKQLWW